MNSQFKQIESQERPLLNHFLKQNKQGKAGKHERVFVLYDTQIIACARLIPLNKHDQYWLRGVFVKKELRGQGLGKTLLTDIQSLIEKNTTLFTFPLAHLGKFYHDLGYVDCDIDSLPEALQLRYQSAQLNKKTWLCMQYLKH